LHSVSTTLVISLKKNRNWILAFGAFCNETLKTYQPIEIDQTSFHPLHTAPSTAAPQLELLLAL
jgi:hypothetical protein